MQLTTLINGPSCPSPRCTVPELSPSLRLISDGWCPRLSHQLPRDEVLLLLYRSKEAHYCETLCAATNTPYPLLKSFMAWSPRIHQ